MRFKFFLETGFAGCRHDDEFEVDDDEWNAMTEDERQEHLDEICQDMVHNHIDYGCYPADEDEGEKL